MNHALDLGLNVCISTPPGKLASKYAIKLPTCRCNTVHTNYFTAVGSSKLHSIINWSLSEVHVPLVDEVVKLSHIVMHVDVISCTLKSQMCIREKCSIHITLLLSIFPSIILQMSQLNSEIVQKIILTRNLLPLKPLLVFEEN